MQDFSLARRAMVDNQLRPKGVTDRGVLAAMGKVERERFVPGSGARAGLFRSLAEDRRGPVDDAAGSAWPAADRGSLPRPGERALVVGSGTGYSAAVLREIGLDVVALESDESARCRGGDRPGSKRSSATSPTAGAKGAPYDLILLDGAVEEIPAALIKQLATADASPARSSTAGLPASSSARSAGGVARTAQPRRCRCRAHFPDSNGHGPSLSDVERRAMPVTRNIAIASLLVALATGYRFGRHAAGSAGFDLSAPTRRSPPSAKA